AAHFPDLQIITNDDNIGFAAANNAGIRTAQGPTLLLLNPDAAVRGEAIARLYRFLEHHPEAGAVGGKLLNRDGTPQVGFNVRAFPSLLTAACELLLVNALWPGNPVNRRYRCLDWDYQTVREADQPAGACLMVRRSVIEQVGGLDEQFFPAWFEDVDWC